MDDYSFAEIKNVAAKRDAIDHRTRRSSPRSRSALFALL